MALADLAWRGHLKRCRMCRLGHMGGPAGLCARGRELSYQLEYASSRRRG